MRFTWVDYTTEYEEVVDSWLDIAAKRFSGIESSFNEFYDYWVNEANTKVNKNFWVKLIFEDNNPIGVIAIALCEREFNIMEFIISPEKRGKGIGPQILKELLASGERIIGAEILNAIAVIFHDNIQSQKAFEKAGFKYESTHADEDVLYYRYLGELIIVGNMFPLFIDHAKVIEYTNEGDFGKLYNKEINYLAIGHYENDEGFYLFLCDVDNNVIDDFLFSSMAELKNSYIDTGEKLKMKDINWITSKI